jgi:phosphoribosylaminoimidazolecarboxamide formyltransferase/IMP cyclohydrolase
MIDDLNHLRPAAQSLVKIKRALVSVSDKTGVVEITRKLHEFGIEIISTGGTARALKEAGLPVVLVDDITRFPECFGGRLKTLSPAIYGGLLYRRDNPSHVADARRLEMPAIDLVVCNLYPFEKFVDSGATIETLVENIDIGGPCMIRAAAKNHESVAVLVDPMDYSQLASELSLHDGGTTFDFRCRMASKAFNLTATYDSIIAREFQDRFDCDADRSVPEVVNLKARMPLRYGENPHQRAFVVPGLHPGVASSLPIHGKELSWNNFLDADGAWRLVNDMAAFAQQGTAFGDKQGSAVAIIKHGNPCGAAISADSATALTAAWAQDPVSAFGGVIAFSTVIKQESANFFADKFVEVIIAPGFDQGAFQLLSKKKNLRLVQVPLLNDVRDWQIRSISGGFLMQEDDHGLDREWLDACEKKFSDSKLTLAKFGVILAKHLKSNAIALVAQTRNGFELAGAGMGQPNRIDCFARLALPRAMANLERLRLSASDLVLASDAFFPFADTIEAAAAAGIKFIVQPGGSVRDDEVISACCRLGVSMVLTGRRHFRH